MTFIVDSDPLFGDFDESDSTERAAEREKRNAILSYSYLWPGAIVPYEISSYFNGISLA